MGLGNLGDLNGCTDMSKCKFGLWSLASPKGERPPDNKDWFQYIHSSYGVTDGDHTGLFGWGRAL